MFRSPRIRIASRSHAPRVFRIFLPAPDMLKQLVPDWARRGYRRMRRAAEHRSNRQQTPEQVFSKIYEQGLWGGGTGEFCSGSGSTEEHAAAYVKALTRYIEKHNIR